MATLPSSDDFAIPLVRCSSLPPDSVATRPDRMSAAGSGALMGALGGVLALGAVHALDMYGLAAAVNHVAADRHVPFTAAFLFGYLTAGAVGAVVGALFGNVTRYLRKWPALALWSVVFFISVAMVYVTALSAFGHGIRVDLAGPVIGAATLYGLIVSFSLPIRRPS